jgi:hypothetical protein
VVYHIQDLAVQKKGNTGISTLGCFPHEADLDNMDYFQFEEHVHGNSAKKEVALRAPMDKSSPPALAMSVKPNMSTCFLQHGSSNLGHAQESRGIANLLPVQSR